MIADFVTALVIRATGQNLQKAYAQSFKSLELAKLLENPGNSKIFFDSLAFI